MIEGTPSPLCFRSATDLSSDIRRGEISSRELMQACLDQINRCNPYINAIPNLIDPDEALRYADLADQQRSRGEMLGVLHGLPIAIKDLADVKGMTTTRGSPLLLNNVAESDSLFVKRLRAAGAIIIGKTNTPEFGAGSHTFNPIYGVTRNPYDLDKTAGGSSGGAAAALASGMLPIADGSDMGGSLRNPAAFNGICAIRPSVGRVPQHTPDAGWMIRHTVEGPMGRTISDVALLLSVMAGHDDLDPCSIPESGARFREPLKRDCLGLRLAWGGDLSIMDVEPEVLCICETSLVTFRDLGCNVEEAAPDLGDAMDVFQVQRAMGMTRMAKQLDSIRPDWRGHVKDTVLWNIDRGLALTVDEIVRSDASRLEIYRRMARFFEHYDYLLLPATQVAPFDVEHEWVRSINGKPMKTYIDWMRACCVITVTGCPAASVPCGFTASGLPVGLQIVGRPRGEFEVLQLAYMFEKASRFARPLTVGH